MNLSPAAAAAGFALAAWLYLLLLRDGFWRADQRLGVRPDRAAAVPCVVAIVPARNEAAHVGQAVAALLGQDYPNLSCIIVVDDGSDDGTAEAAAAAGDSRLKVIPGSPLPPGWTGKLWAVTQGIDQAVSDLPEASYVLLTDADIALAPDEISRLVATAEGGGLDLVSLMVRLNCTAWWERLLIPAFIFFFQKLYPFPAVNDPARPMAAAAGGCMLVRRKALERIGGMAAIRDRIIDDCALAAAIKPGGPVWLGLADKSRSMRAYDTLGGIWRMGARTAFVQLDNSVWKLAAATLAMMLVYLAPPAVLVIGALTGDGAALAAAAAAWGIMIVCYRPTLSDYGLGGAHGLLLPAAALIYLCMTIDSARRSFAGRGAGWKGRVYPGGSVKK
ncbi:MAG: glycosyltransferase [Alphaproteobacteria bacterium]